MPTSETPPDPPAVVRRLDTETSGSLVGLVAIFEDLQMVLRCCERLVGGLAAEEPDSVLIEAVWTEALLSYARCFSVSETRAALTEADVLGFCRQRMPFEKSPKVVVFGTEIPVTSTGKYQRLRLQERFGEWEHTQFRK